MWMLINSNQCSPQNQYDMEDIASFFLQFYISAGDLTREIDMIVHSYTLLTLKYKVNISTHIQKSHLHAIFSNNKNRYFCI